jgi:hypothetical protein
MQGACLLLKKLLPEIAQICSEQFPEVVEQRANTAMYFYVYEDIERGLAANQGGAVRS